MSDLSPIDAEKNEIKRLRDEFLKKMMPAAAFISREVHCDVLPLSGDYLPNGSGYFRVRTKQSIDSAAFDTTQEKLKNLFGEQNVRVYAEPDVESAPEAHRREAAFHVSGSVDQLIQTVQQLNL